jgi:hypothetical protein
MDIRLGSTSIKRDKKLSALEKAVTESRPSAQSLSWDFAAPQE